MLDAAPIHPSQVASLSDSEVRELAVKLLARVERHACEIVSRDAKIEKLAFEVAHLRRLKFGVKSEQLNAQQKALFEEALDADIAALEARLKDLKAPPKGDESRNRPKRTALPPNLPSARSLTSPRARHAPAAARSNASARTSARSWTTRPACSPPSAMCAVNGHVVAAAH